MTSADNGGRVLRAALDLGLPDDVAELVAVHAPATAAGPGGVVVACDLDRTLIYSAKALGLDESDVDVPPLAVSEIYRGAPISFHTRAAELMLSALDGAATFVPVTTRTQVQYARVRLTDRLPGYAVTSNGGHILVDGRPDGDWSRAIVAQLEVGCLPLAEVLEHLDKVTSPLWLRSQRVADDLFVYLVVERAELPGALVAELRDWGGERGWTVSLQGRKLYCVPDLLTKSRAVAEIAKRVGGVRLLAAGDSLLDAAMLADADEAIRPAHGELHDLGWRLPHVSVTERSGVLAGQEIVARQLAAVLAR